MLKLVKNSITYTEEQANAAKHNKFLTSNRKGMSFSVEWFCVLLRKGTWLRIIAIISLLCSNRLLMMEVH